MDNTLQSGLWKSLKKLCIEQVTFGQCVYFCVDVSINIDGVSNFKFSVEDKILKENVPYECSFLGIQDQTNDYSGARSLCNTQREIKEIGCQTDDLSSLQNTELSPFNNGGRNESAVPNTTKYDQSFTILQLHEKKVTEHNELLPFDNNTLTDEVQNKAVKEGEGRKDQAYNCIEKIVTTAKVVTDDSLEDKSNREHEKMGKENFSVDGSTQTDEIENVMVSTQTDFEDVTVQKSRRKSTSSKRKKKSLLESIQLKELSVNIEPLDIKQEVQEDDNFEPPMFSDDDSETDGVTVVPELPPDTEMENKIEKEDITCPLCPSVFRSQEGAENHLRQKHDIGNVYICKICQDICPSNTALRLHMEEDHAIFSDEEDAAPKKRGRKGRPRTVKKIKINVLPAKKPPKPKKSSSKSKKSKSKGKSKSKAKSTPISATKIKIKKIKPDIDDDEVPSKMPTKNELDALSCFECDKTFSCKRALIRHNKTVHAVLKHQFQCDACGKRFTSKETLYHHKRGIHGNNKPYTCDECGQTFNFNHSLRLHRLKHSGQRPHQCTECDKSYLTSNHLKMHVEGVHQAKKNHMCRFCPKSFSYRTSLQVHELTHGNIRPYKCSVCGHGFINSHSLKYHFESKHALSTWFYCDICGKKYKTEFLMKTHRRRHTADGSRYMCDICGRQFMYKSTLEIHAAVHSEEKTFVCSVCGKSFKTYATLYSHQYVHKTESPFKCPDCGKPFKTKERCKAHQRRHSGLKPFECDICGRCFPDKGGLSKHKKTVHCEVKKFKCPYCGKTCSRADNLRVHMKIHGKGTGKSEPSIDKQIAEAVVSIQPKQEQRNYETLHTPSPVAENLHNLSTSSMSPPPTMMPRAPISMDQYVLNSENNSMAGINMTMPMSHTSEMPSPIPPTNITPIPPPNTTALPPMSGVSPYTGMYMWPYAHSSAPSQPHDGNNYY